MNVIEYLKSLFDRVKSHGVTPYDSPAPAPAPPASSPTPPAPPAQK